MYVRRSLFHVDAGALEKGFVPAFGHRVFEQGLGTWFGNRVLERHVKCLNLHIAKCLKLDVGGCFEPPCWRRFEVLCWRVVEPPYPVLN